jgi:hypothetical protein
MKLRAFLSMMMVMMRSDNDERVRLRKKENEFTCMLSQFHRSNHTIENQEEVKELMPLFITRIR